MKLFCSLLLLGLLLDPCDCLAQAAQSAPPLAKPAAGATVTTPSGLQYVDLFVGKGVAAEKGRRVGVLYTGRHTNGVVFETRVDRSKPFMFELGARQVIPGWEEGIVGMRVGGKRRLMIPARLAYGSASVRGIRPNSDLTFDIELVSVGRPQKRAPGR
jgi:peptidylprolyl isomerase